MKNSSNRLNKYGFDRWRLDRPDFDCPDGHTVARVVAVHRDSYVLTDGEQEFPAELMGKIVYSADSPLDFPAVGDWVLAVLYDGGAFAIIHEILPRTSVLKRKTPGKKIDFQLIAANIDLAFIVQSLNDNFNLRRLERYLVVVNESQIVPVVLLSKTDLIDPETVSSRISEINRIMPDLTVLPFSNKNEEGLRSIHRRMKAGMTCCLLGSSGVGKTSLLNKLAGENRFCTRDVRKKDGKGRHATTSRQLIRLDGGAMIIDTPGMRELGLLSSETGLAETFDEIAALAGSCRFGDCTHEHEEGCAVLQALADGRLAKERYRNFLKMSRESVYNSMSYRQKRQKDRAFGKMVKSVMKSKKNRR